PVTWRSEASLQGTRHRLDAPSNPQRVAGARVQSAFVLHVASMQTGEGGTTLPPSSDGSVPPLSGARSPPSPSAFRVPESDTLSGAGSPPSRASTEAPESVSP